MAAPPIQPHLQRLLKTEHTVILSLFRTIDRGGQPCYTCALKAPANSRGETLEHGTVYALECGTSPDDAVYAAREKLWSGL